MVKVIVSQLCRILCDPRDCSLPGSSVHGISQALEADSLPSEPPGKPPYSSCLDKWDFGSLVKCSVQFSSVQSLSHVQVFATPWTAERQASLSIINSRSSPKLMSTESMMPSNHLILCWPLLLLPSTFPASGSFPMSQLFTAGGQILEFQLQHQSFQWTHGTYLL